MRNPVRDHRLVHVSVKVFKNRNFTGILTRAGFRIFWWCNDAVATDAKDKSILSVSVGFLDFDDLLSPTLLRV
jgi:glucan phosphoethanolaminetransferase (alkaline phosphatase superfamily)